MSELNEELIGKLKQEHGPDLISASTPMGEMVFKRPPRMVWTDFVDSISKDRASKDAALRRLALACVVLPSMSDAARIFDAYPALPASVASELSDLAGAGGTFDVKKL